MLGRGRLGARAVPGLGQFGQMLAGMVEVTTVRLKFIGIDATHYSAGSFLEK
jgi:hypothetical protein